MAQHTPLRDWRRRLALALSIVAFAATSDAAESVRSPDGRIEATFDLREDGAPFYRVDRAGAPVLLDSQLGLVRDDADFTRGLVLREATAAERIEDRYELLTAKRRHNAYVANRRVFRLATADGQRVEIVFQVSDDGVALRYRFPEQAATPRTITAEATSFRFAPEAKAWLQPIAVAKTGFAATNPSYEEYYQREIPVGTPSTLGAGWVFPALFRTGETWVLLSETGLGRDYCGTRLRHESPNGEYRIGFPDPRETMAGRPVNPVSTLPWETPWRLIALGDLRTIAESMLGTDLAAAPVVRPGAAPRPGKSSWSWPLLGDGQTVYEVQKRFIDYAAEMGWAYCLIDAQWDQQIGYEKTAELAAYGRTKNVELLLWYNSNGTANEAPQTPKDRLLTHESRIREFERLRAMGIRGLKIDFFGGDGQPVIEYYHDILADAAPYGFLLNFHGATFPRGWQRTYPHLMTMEAVRGFEFVTFEQANADQEPSHAAMLPFTRNVFDPMDFTPLSLAPLSRIVRRTTPAFELALSVLFVSGVQHYVEIPEGMAEAPTYVREFLRAVPSVWEDSKFLDGYPGDYAVFARRAADRWYVAGINGAANAKTVALNLGVLAPSGRATLIADGDGAPFRREEISWDPQHRPMIVLPAHGGFVLDFPVAE
ncbi:MAG TPA: glycoside hydrolase family 97 catalytic domain-containing protein [Opitutaceae bacterium]|nr:glycoside hydrolase family 97 catalytic domain-containing protein [Opitutaceae bacterium]